MSFREVYTQEKLWLHDKKSFLDLLENSLPFQSKNGNLQVSILDKATGKASRWRYWQEVRDNDWWVNNCNNRLISTAEIVQDIDPDNNESDSDFLLRVKRTIKIMLEDISESGESAKLLGVFNTGSRGVHIHVLMPKLVFSPKREAEAIKRLLQSNYGADTSKATLRSMIAIEGSPHWKTGKNKEEVTL